MERKPVADLKRDPIVWLYLAALALLSLPNIFPLLPRDQLEKLSNLYSDIVLLSITIFVFQWGLRKLTHAAERRFWNYVTTAFGFWYVVRILYVVVPDGWWTHATNVLTDALYVSFYLSFLAAIDVAPHARGDARRNRTRSGLNSYGGLVFAFGLLVYFVLIPSNLNRSFYDTWLPSLYLYVALDLFLLVRFLLLRHECRNPRWRALYGLLALTVGLWAATDLLECLVYAGALHWQVGDATDLLWILPFVPIGLAARLRHHSYPAGEEEPAGDALPEPAGLLQPTRNYLVGYAFSLPSIHLTFHLFGLLDPALQSARTVVVLLGLIALGTMALLEHFHLERRTRILQLERRRAEEALRDSEEQLRQSQKMEAIGRLAGGVAHDFNNLLTVIKGYAELLLSEMDPQEKPRVHAEEIDKTAQRATDLTQQLLALSRRQPMQPQVLDLNTVVSEMDKLLRRVLGEDIERITLLRPAVGFVQADPGQIEQVLLNLAVNARDAMPGGGKFTIETSAEHLDEAFARGHPDATPGPHVALTVSDTGCGMDEGTLSHIFEPFFTTKQKGEGTGLGLATVYGLVRQSNGCIQVRSQPGRGTTVQIFLPALEETGPQDAAEESPVEVRRGSETVLVVEDEMSVRRLTREFLEINGYHVLEAIEGNEAIRISAHHQGPIHLLLTDVVMPRMNGRELAQRLAPQRPEMRVLYMSGYPEDSTRSNGSSEPGPDFLQKPFTLNTLAGKVREALEGSASPRTPA